MGRFRSPLALGVSLAVGVYAIAACIGSDPAVEGNNDAGAPGARFGPCFTNGTCNANLSCIDGFCLLPGDPLPDGGVTRSDAAGDDGGRVADAADEEDPTCAPPSPSGGIPCGLLSCNPASELCCQTAPSMESCLTGVQCAATGDGEQGFACSLPSHCGTGLSCCFTRTTNPGGAPGKICSVVHGGYFASGCKPACDTNDEKICVSNADCNAAGSQCVTREIVSYMSVPRVVRFCTKP